MSETKRISPMLDNFDIGGSISEHDGVRCYPAMRKDSDDRYIVKTVSIPASQTQLDALLLTGAFPNAASALTYFKDLADRTVDELEILRRLSQLEGFLPYESWQVCAKDDDIGFDVYMLSSYKRTLRKYLQKQPMTHLGAINLGLDICAALAVCRRSGYLYVDLKPNNIYVVDERQFRIGDLGFIPLDSLTYASLPDKYRSEYTAPEIQDAFATLNTTIDIYALGLILYQVYNGGILPSQEDTASLDKLPAPVNADYEMAEIILKACDPNPDARWQDPIQMGQALVSYMQRNGANDTPIVPPVIPSTEPLSAEDIDLSGIDFTNIPDIEGLDEEIVSDAEFSEIESDVTSAEEFTDLDEAAEETPNEEASAEEPDVEMSMPEDPAAEEPTEELGADHTIAQELLLDDAVQYDEDNFGNLSFLEVLPTDETSPENNISDVQYDEVSDELSQILAQADELVAHPVPDPVVAPEPIDVPIPEPVQEESADKETGDDENTAEPHAADTQDDFDGTVDNAEPAEKVAADSSLAETVVIPSQVVEAVADVPEDTEPETANDNEDEMPVKKKASAIQWILNAVIILLILAILTVGFFYYKNIYLLPIDSISVSGDESSMVVHLDSSIDETLLSVVCSDSHGNQISAPVVNGTATFANLAPDTAYTVQILVDGFHRLTGETAGSYSTPAQTKVVQFNAVTGAENGSVILGFTVEGPDNGDWTVAYSADGEKEKTVELLSHMVTLSDLTIGKEYTFTLIPGDDMYVTGQTQITFTASELVYAQDVAIVSCVNNQLTVNWVAPDSSSITEWTVRCYDDTDYNKTIITADTTAVFEDIDPAKSYTVEVTAAGMSVSQRAYMAANAITITDFTADTSSATKLVLSWNASQDVPEDGWVLLYSVDDSNIQSSIVCMENRAVISPVVPDATYSFTLQLTNGDAVLTLPLRCQTNKAQDFSGYGMIRSSMTYKLCNRPEDADWEHSDLSNSDYTNSFSVGEDISVVGQLHDTYGISDDEIVMLYVFRNADGNVVNYCYTESTWSGMWYKSYGEFNVPQAPSEPGDYTLSIYFNGKLVTNKDVTIEE